MKFRTGITVSLLGLGAIAVILLFGTVRFGWISGSDSESPASAGEVRSPHVYSGGSAAFGPECGEDGFDVVVSGYGNITDLEYHTNRSLAVVEGIARVAGPARFGMTAYSSDLGRNPGLLAASRILTPFTIEVSTTHKGPEKPEWAAFVSGGLIECLSYRISADSVRLFDGATGLFFITDENEDHEGNAVTMTIAKEGPDWFTFTEDNFGSIDEAIRVVRAAK